MYSIIGTTIKLTRGDSFYCTIALQKNGETYTPAEGDTIRFVMKQNICGEALIEKAIPMDTLVLYIAPEDTAELKFGRYVYDLEMTYANGDVDTFINNANFHVMPEVAT